ncbi:hypothetical protein ANN_16278 [Periplaneta americana]|uniref:Reverse transcriptase domain-containing protein n=1 Tax=Periplaneta americana TaxID=6978 RepID=A0ABQ8SII6_PERAM|nr:hypothetical protein ANN_16278 [Periplaneta americana]
MPSTWPGIEPATVGIEGQRYTNLPTRFVSLLVALSYGLFIYEGFQRYDRGLMLVIGALSGVSIAILELCQSFNGFGGDEIMEKKWEYKGTVHQLFIDFKKAYDSVKREVLYDILIEFGIPKKLVRLIKMCLSETYSRVRIGQFLSDAFPIHCGLKQGDALSPLLFNFALEYAIRKVQDKRGFGIERVTSAACLCG